MNQPTRVFWKLMNKYHLNRTGNFFHWLEKLNGYGVLIGDYNRIIHYYERNIRAINKEQKNFPEEMPGSIQKHHNKYSLRFFKSHFHQSEHNLYLYYYLESIGYMSFHSITNYDIKTLQLYMKDYLKHQTFSGNIHSSKLSVIKHLPKYVKDEIGLSANYTYSRKGKPIKINSCRNDDND